jgi:tripartite-type tricarboxylate transporter receptor subunit TctC
MTRGRLIVSTLAAAPVVAVRRAFAQSYPSRPIRWVMPFPPEARPT